MIYLYRQPEAGEFTVIGADPAEGNDNTAFVVISKKYADILMVGVSKEESPQLGYSLNHIGRYLKQVTNYFPVVAVERNTGIATLHVLKELNYPSIYRPAEPASNPAIGKEEKYGWHTNAASRVKMLDDLALAIRQRLIKIPSKEVVDELYTFIRHAKTGKPQADTGAHDDLVMALAIAWQAYQTEVNPETINTSTVVMHNKKSRATWRNLY